MAKSKIVKSNSKVKNEEIKKFCKLESTKIKIKNTQKNIEKLKTQLLKESKTLFEEGCKSIFETHKEFDSFAWTQYTMHWNDGDPTQFDVYSENIYINDEEKSQEIYELEQLCNQLKNKDKSIAKLEKEIKVLEKDKKNNDWKIQSNKNQIKELQASNLEEVEKRLSFLKEVVDLLTTVDSESMEEMFGNDAKVIVSREGVSVESYDHD